MWLYNDKQTNKQHFKGFEHRFDFLIYRESFDCFPCRRSGCVVVCDLRPVQFHYVSQSLNWYEAFQKCRQTYTDLANIQGPANNSEAQQAASGGHIWIGLFRNMWKWSQTGLVQSSWFRKWAGNEPGTGQCVIISKFGFWSTRDCTVQNHFICYSGELFLNSPTSASNKVYTHARCCT